MKKLFALAALLCVGTLATTTVSRAASLTTSAASLTAIYNFSDQLDASTTSFEGLDFTNDGTLWITSSPNLLGTKQVIGVDLESTTVVDQAAYKANTTSWFSNFLINAALNPVGLASDGENLFVVSNEKSTGNKIFTGVDPSGDPVSLSTYNFVRADACNDAEGAAYLNGFVYVSCQDSQNVVKIDATTGAVVENINFGVNLLGLGATEDSLIVGDYTNHALLLYDVAKGEITQTIDLAELFVGEDSDYAQLTRASYEVTIVDNGDIRSIPDPDGIAYKNGKIYMTFEHDLRVFEIDLNPPAVPEPGTLLLLGIGLLGLAKLRKTSSK